jgi:hydroxyethylthiazole kinase-like sugar kinase family protein
VKRLELFLLVVGTGVLAYALITRTLSTQAVGVIVFCYALATSSIADREGAKGPSDFLRQIVDAIMGRR